MVFDVDGNPKNILEMIWRWVLIALWSLREILRTAWAIARGPVILALQILAALVVLFEEWGWKPLSALLGKLAQFAPFAFLERLIASLPPYAALCVFALPTVFLLPLKFFAMWLLANGKVWTATALFAGAKVASTAFIARIFTLTKPQLMQIGWFAACLQLVRAVEGSAVHADPHVVGLALWSHGEEPGEARAEAILAAYQAARSCRRRAVDR